MELSHKLLLTIGGTEYHFRSMTGAHLSNSYVNSLKESSTYIKHITQNVQEQKEYINDIRESPNNTICGLFLGQHLIGTTGIQNLYPDKFVRIAEGFNHCTLGILITDRTMLGKGFGKTLVWSACVLANKCCGTRIFEAGIKKHNDSSLKSFLSCGFKIVEEYSNSIRVSLDLNEIVKPTLIDNVIIKLRQ